MFSDDAVLRNILKSWKKNGIWTQIILGYMVKLGIISNINYYEKIILLMSLNYQIVIINENDILEIVTNQKTLDDFKIIVDYLFSNYRKDRLIDIFISFIMRMNSIGGTKENHLNILNHVFGELSTQKDSDTFLSDFYYRLSIKDNLDQEIDQFIFKDVLPLIEKVSYLKKN